MMTIFNQAPFSVSEKKGLFASSSFTFANEEERQIAIKLADKALSYELTALPATLYMEYARNGNRSHYEKLYYERRDILHALLLGCLASGDEKYTDKMIDVLWAILEETSWVIPAHNISHPYELGGEPLPDAFSDDIVEIDLFSAETASLLAWVYHYEKERLDKVTPVIGKRIEFEITRRILNPFRRLEMRWMSHFINNWTPWIVSNVLVVSAIFVSEWHTLQHIIYTSMGYLDRFVMTYGEDGGCNEGANYWTQAVATLFDSVCILYDVTGGTLDVLRHPMLRRMCEYFPDVCLSAEERLVANFADCSRHVMADRRLFARMGELTGSEKMKKLSYAFVTKESFRLSRYNIYRELTSLTEPMPEQKQGISYAEPTVFYKDLELAVLRRGEFFLAIKGGHNGESHNHNDIGSFILYRGTTPVIIDVGVGVYTKDTFSDKRYTIWTMQSSFHNLPEIDGMMQLPGREYQADGFTTDGDTVSVSYRGAYSGGLPASAVTRRITVKEENLVICDEVCGAESVIYNLMLAERPKKIQGGFAVGGSEILFDGEYTVEEIDITYDSKLHHDWQRDSLYRVRIPSLGKLTTVIKKA